MYPNSVLTDTVYSRTHSEQLAPKKPVLEEGTIAPIVVKCDAKDSKPSLTWSKTLVQIKSELKNTIARKKFILSNSIENIATKIDPPKKEKIESSNNKPCAVKGRVTISWTQDMIKDMFETHSEAVKELQTNVNSVIDYQSMV